MNTTSWVLCGALTFAGLGMAVTAADSGESDSGYQLALYQNCELLTVKDMSEEQYQAHQKLQTASDKMKGFHQPINSIQPELDSLTAQIQELTDRAVVKKDGKTIIDHKLLDEQQVLSQKISALVADNKPHFNALEQQGKQVELAARDFEKAIAPLVQGESFQSIQVIGPGETLRYSACL